MSTRSPTESDGSGPRRVGPAELLDIREAQWRPFLDGVSLVSEATVPHEHREQAATALGMVATRQLDKQLPPRLHRWPACMAVTTVGIATDHYSSGSFWPALWDHTGIPHVHRHNATWGDAFLSSLELLDLDTFSGATRQKYVGPIVLHAGVPTYCLGDLFDLILQRVHADPGLDAHGLHAWALGGLHRIDSLDVPARDFLRSGRDYALETIERCMHLLELLQDDPDAACGDAGLLDRFRHPAVEALERARAQGTLPRWGPASPARRLALRPALRLDPYVHGVHVTLPADDHGDDVRWDIVTDDDSHQITARRTWDADEPTVFTLPRPARTVSVAPRGTGVWQRLPLVAPDDPLLLFTEDGALISTDLALPPGTVWVLYPGDRTVERSPGVETVEVGEAPYGWQGWELTRVRVGRSDWIGLDGGPRHRAQGRSRPEVELSDPVAGISTTHGAPVYASRPTVQLPDDPGSSATWHVEVRSADTGRTLARVAGDRGERLRPFDPLPSPVVGTFVVRARGPLGRGVQRQVTVAEGLEAEHTPRVRHLTREGLVPGRTELAAPRGMTAEPAQYALAPDQVSARATLRNSTSALTVSVVPPHLRVLTTGGHTPRWSAEPLRLHTETIAEAGDLLVRLPEGEDPSLVGDLCVRDGAEFAQWVQTRHDPGSTLRYPLGQVAGTAADRGSVDLVVGYATHVVPLAVVRPRRLATGAVHDDGVIRLGGFAGAKDVQAAVYTDQAPWAPPWVLPVSTDGRIELPREAPVAGTLYLHLAFADPWSVTDWPRWPDPGAPNTLVCAVPGETGFGDAAERELSLALRDENARLDGGDGGPDTARLWQVVNLRDALVGSGAFGEPALRPVESALSGSPRAALIAHPDAGPSPRESVIGLVGLGIAAAPIDPCIDPAWAAGLWDRLPVAACLAGAHALAHCDLDSPAPEHTEFLERLVHRCGPQAWDILRGGDDPDRGTGMFDDATLRMTSLTAGQFDAMWRAARVVPRALLDGDSRSNAAMALFTVRDDRALRTARRQGREAIETCRAGLARLGSPYRSAATTLVRSRSFTGTGLPSWHRLPEASLALAVTARLAARGMSYFASLAWAQSEAWEALARCAPELVATDIVLAELVLCGAERATDREESR